MRANSLIQAVAVARPTMAIGGTLTVKGEQDSATTTATMTDAVNPHHLSTGVDVRADPQSLQHRMSPPLSHWQMHRNRKRVILNQFPQIFKLYGTDNRTQFYAYALIILQIWLAWLCRNSLLRSLLLGVLVGPFVDNGVLCFMHEATHLLVFRNAAYNRVLSIIANCVMIIPISEIFRQHHHKHHQKLGDDHFDVDVPTPEEIAWVGNSSIRKALWLMFNMIILPARSLARLPVDVDKYLIANWVSSIGFGVVTFFYSRPSFLYLMMSTLQAQGLHPANTRQVQRHVHNGDKRMTEAISVLDDNMRPSTYSYYGFINYLTLNVGYHVEHHDFCCIPWTKLPELRRIAGEKWYPSCTAHDGRGMIQLINFVTNPNISLEDFAHE